MLNHQVGTASNAGSLAAGRNHSCFSPTIPGAILWDYEEEKTQITSLYELAKEKTWNVSTDVEWATFSRFEHYPAAQGSNPLCGFEPYEALDEAEKIRISWWHHGLEISEILHGEQGALVIASQLVACLPTVEAKLFAASQVFDEARHVEFFSRYLQEVVTVVHDPSAELKALITLTIDDPRWDMKFIACQILIESLAMAKFQEIRAKCLVPMMQFAVGYIARDEARHVRFGAQFLKRHIEGLGQSAIEERSEFVLDNVLKLADAMNIYTRIADQMHWDVVALRLHLRRFRILNRETTRDRFRQLILNLSAVGLLTEKSRERITGLNLHL